MSVFQEVLAKDHNCMLDADIKEGEGSVLDLEQQYLFLLIGYTTKKFDDEAGIRETVQAILIGRDAENLHTWKRIGRPVCMHCKWEHWSNIASPFRFTWV